MTDQSNVVAFRLAPTQEKLCRLGAYPDPGPYVATLRAEIEGRLDHARLRRTIAAAVSHYEILRTRLRSVADVSLPVQVIAPAGHDASVLDVAIERVARGRHRVTIAAPATCADAATLEELWGIVCRSYGSRGDASRGSGGETDVPQFADAAELMHSLMESAASAGTRVDGAAGTVLEPFSPAQIQQFRPAEVAGVLSPEVTRALIALATRLALPLRSVVFGCWCLLLAKREGAEAAAVGLSTDGRIVEQLAGALGPFARHLAVHAPLSPEMPVRDGLASCHAAAVRAESRVDRDWQSCLPGDDGAVSGFAHAFEWRPRAPRGAIGGARCTIAQLSACVDIFRLRLLAGAGEDAIALTLQYDTSAIDRETAASVLTQFETLCAEVAADAERPIRLIDRFSGGARTQAIGISNGPAREDPASSLTSLLEAQAAATPDQDAVVFGSRRIDYRELHRRAHLLAARLRDAGVGPDAVVAVFMERSIELVVALLGILKAGGAYLPLGTGEPEARLALVFGDARPAAVVLQPALAARFPGGGTRIEMEEDWGANRQDGAAPRATQVSPDNLAYVIYTSGSTGVPKGAMNTHRGVANRLQWMQERYALTAGDRVLQKTPYTFDVSVWEFFWPLLSGATLVVAPPDAHRDPAAMWRLSCDERITTLHFVPSMLQPFLLEAATGGHSALRQVICSGEALPLDLQQRLFARLPAVRLHNLYGPTEAAIDVTAWECRPDNSLSYVPIGTPIANMQALPLDRGMQPCPLGVPGELHLAGVGLARGYLGRPGLTAERFVPHPHASSPGARAYKTGDLVRSRAEGHLEFLGRNDHQVKVRGFRIELGEIEAALLAHDHVAQATVMACTGRDDRTQLIAFVVAAPGQTMTLAEIRDHLKRRVPEYMVPAGFVVVDALPLTASGKVDRTALAARADEAWVGSAEGYVAPRTSAEEVLSAIWADVLGRERIGVHDNFFELGGHSLLATQVIWSVRHTLHIDLPLRSLFEAPTLAAFAQRVLETGSGGGGAVPPPIERVTRTGPLVPSYGQERLWFLNQLEPESSAYNIRVAIRLHGTVDVPALTAAANAVIARHDVLRTSFVDAHGRGVPHVAAQASLEIPVVETTVEEAPAIVARECRRVFDLGTAPLVRLTLLRLDAGEHLLIVVMHHILSDAWSMGILAQELSEVYRAARQHEPWSLPPLPIQYVDYAAWQRRWVASGELDEQLAYWRTTLAGAPRVFTLPLDRPRPRLSAFTGAYVRLPFSAQVSAAVKQLSRTSGTTLFMTLLAGLDVVLSRYTGEDDVVLGTAITGRNRSETAQLVGFFVHTLVMRTQVSGDPSFRELLTRVRDTALDAFAHQDVPFDRIVEDLQPERELSQQPLFQIMLVLQNAPRHRLALQGLRSELGPTAATMAKFDLTLVVAELGESITATAEYATELFDRTTIERLLRHWEGVLGAAVANPDRPISQLALLDADECAQVVTAWNATGMAWPRTSLPELIAAQAAAAPEALAVSDDRAAWTYRDLRTRTREIAAALRGTGVGPEQIVAVCVERSAALVAALLGVLEAGAAYLPLDPSHPADRLAYVMADSGATVLLTEAALAGTLPPALTAAARVLLVDDLPASAAIDKAAIEEAASRAPLDTPASSVSPSSPISRASPEALAYVMYTSGSTGRPKGVLISHGALTNFLLAMRTQLAVGSGDRVLALTPASFDIAGLELYLPLIAGGSCHVASRATAQDVTELQAALTARRPTLVQATPATWTMLAQAGWQNPAGARLLCGGEALPPRLQAWLAATGPEAWNLFGPTETTIWSTAARLTPGADTVSIGTPIANTQVYVLDPRGMPAPIGVPGELFIGGAGLARGYWRRPALTAEQFVPDSFAATPGARLYRTGDRARWRADGQLEFLGRRDAQIKLHGFRIELEEIEHHLSAHPTVRDCAVVVQGDDEGRQLVAFCVPNGTAGELEDGASLRAHLKTTLPAYMVPTGFVAVDAIPLTPNGKVDRKALARRAAELRLDEHAEEYVAPRTPIEEVLAAVWADVLRRSRVGIHDNFFELGGDSMIGLQVVSRANEHGVGLSPRQIFQFQTIAELAAAATADAESDLISGAVR